MALFGAPIAHEDHAQRACYAALHLRDEITRYATEVKGEHGIGFSTCMGLNSGAVVVGRIGDDLVIFPKNASKCRCDSSRCPDGREPGSLGHSSDGQAPIGERPARRLTPVDRRTASSLISYATARIP